MPDPKDDEIIEPIEHGDELTMESTTDTAEQIAAGLGIDPADAEVETAAEPVLEAGAEEEIPAEEPIAEPETSGVPKKAKAKRSVDGAAAAARVASAKKKRDLEAENATLRAQLAAAGKPAADPADGTDDGADAADLPAYQPLAPIKPEEIPDTHPELASIAAEMAALKEPKFEDHPDTDAFEMARLEYVQQRADLRAELRSVRKDVAARATTTRETANRAAHQQVATFSKTVVAARSRYEDYDQVMAAARKADARVSEDLRRAMIESPVGGDLAYYLSKNPKEATRLRGLSPHRQLAELGIIEARITATLEELPPGQGRAAQARPGSRTSRAPEPQSTVLGDGPGVVRTKDLNDPTLPYGEYKRIRDRQEADKRGGTAVH